MTSTHAMSLRYKFAKFTLKYYDGQVKAMHNFPVSSFLAPFILSFGVGIGANVVLNETKELEEFQHPHEELIKSEYSELLDKLAEQQQNLIVKQAGPPFALYKYTAETENSTPPEKNDFITQDLSRQYALKAQQRLYESSKNDFVVAVHVDERLDEKDARDLMASFQSTHGSITALSGFDHELDYANLFEAREIATTKHLPVDERQKAITTNKAAEELYDTGTGARIGLGFGLLPLLLLSLCSISHSTMKRWEGDEKLRRSKRQYKH